MPRSKAIIRPDLGTLAYEYSMDAARQGFIGQLVLPVFTTSLVTAQYPIILAEAMLESADTARAPRTAYARGDWEFDFRDYACRENGWEEPLDDTEAAMFRTFFDAETVAIQRATLMVMRSQERRVAAKIMDTGTFNHMAAATPWNTYATADPLADINKAKDHFKYSVGLKPNALIMDEDILKHISMCDAVMERIKYSSPTAIRGELTLEQLKAYFGVEQILTAGAVYNSAPKRKPKQVTPIWPTDKIMLARISSGGQDEGIEYLLQCGHGAMITMLGVAPEKSVR